MSVTGKLANEVRLAIEARSREFEAFFASGDARGLVASYFVPEPEGPLASPPGGTALVKGTAALEAMFAEQFGAVRAIRLETALVEAAGELAYELGRAHLTLRSGEQALGRYTVLWKRVGTQWRAKVDFFAQDGWPG